MSQKSIDEEYAVRSFRSTRKRQGSLPVALTTALLLSVGRVLAGISSLAEVAREMLLGSSGAVGQANVVTVSGLVGASHYGKLSVLSYSWAIAAIGCIEAILLL